MRHRAIDECFDPRLDESAQRLDGAPVGKVLERRNAGQDDINTGIAQGVEERRGTRAFLGQFRDPHDAGTSDARIGPRVKQFGQHRHQIRPTLGVQPAA